VARYKLTPRARSQLREIWLYIASDNEAAADSLLRNFFEKFERAAAYPEIGQARPDIAVDARMLVEGRYIALYEPTAYGVEIIVVVHGMRDPSTWIGPHP
jgi:toxin ParE1/3/4